MKTIILVILTLLLSACGDSSSVNHDVLVKATTYCEPNGGVKRYTFDSIEIRTRAHTIYLVCIDGAMFELNVDGLKNILKNEKDDE